MLKADFSPFDFEFWNSGGVQCPLQNASCNGFVHIEKMTMRDKFGPKSVQTFVHIQKHFV